MNEIFPPGSAGEGGHKWTKPKKDASKLTAKLGGPTPQSPSGAVSGKPGRAKRGDDDVSGDGFQGEFGGGARAEADANMGVNL